MGSWVFLTGATSGGIINAGRSFAIYDVSADTTKVSELIHSSINSWCTLAIAGDLLCVCPFSEPVEYLSPYYNFLFIYRLDDLSSTDNKIFSYYNYRYNSQIKTLGANSFVYADKYDTGLPYGSSGQVSKINADSTVTIYATLTFNTADRRAFVSANDSLYVFYADEYSYLKYMKSSNGVTWITHSTGVITYYTNYTTYADLTATFGCVITSDFEGAFTTDGGANWTTVTGAPTQRTHVLATAGGVYLVAGGSNIYKSTNGTVWTDLGQPLGTETIYNIAYGNSMYMIVGTAGSVVTTTDFLTFTPFTEVDFGVQNVYGAVYTTESVLLEPLNVSVLDATEDEDIASLRATASSATGTISGTLRLDTSDGDFAARTVHLYTYPAGALVKSTTSDAGTGAWEFTQVSPGDYFVVGVANVEDYETYSRDFDALGVITVD